MKLFDAKQTREGYLRTQIARSEAKFDYCKVSVADVEKYKSLLLHDVAGVKGRFPLGPILCLGTRNGREVDLFRAVFFGARVVRLASRFLERTTPSFRPLWPPLEGIGRSRAEHLSPASVVGVEINSRAARSDIWIGSFDEMPAAWEAAFGVLFSNSFDQSQDPHRTAKEWKRVTRPGGYLIFCFSKDAEPTLSDPVGGLVMKDVLELFGGGLVYYQERGSRNGYSEAILRFGRA